MEAEIEIKLEMSDYITHRSELMRSLEIPKLSDAGSTLGESLAKIVFDQCDEALKVDFGLEPPLKGPLGDLWVSPSDLLIGKVALTPPLTSKHIQALTHEGILKIGREVEKKFLFESQQDKETALAQQKKTLVDSFQDLVKEAIKDVEAKERAACVREIEKLTDEFEAKLLDNLAQLEKQLRVEYESRLHDQKMSLKEKWEEVLQHEVEKTVHQMTKQFLEQLAKQELLLEKEFRLELSKVEIRKSFEMGLQNAKFKSYLQQMIHQLECKSIANMMYLLCMERRKCLEEKKIIETYYKNEIQKLQGQIQLKDNRVRKLAEKVKRLKDEINLRETCVLEIIKEFQKFINFALKAAPTQAEFLLSIEKMLVFELTSAVTSSDFNSFRPCHDFLKWATPRWDTSEEPTSLKVNDYHDCLNELAPPRPKAEQVLPAFYYKRKLYVREDFRDMISRGIEISPSNELWSEDVEILIDQLKKSVSNIPEKTSEVEDSVATQKTVIKEPSKSQLGISKMSGSHRRVSIERDSLSLKVKERPKMSLRAIQESVVDFDKLAAQEDKPTLLAAINSVELIKTKGSVKTLTNEEYEDDDRGEKADERTAEADEAEAVFFNLSDGKESTKVSVEKETFVNKPSILSGKTGAKKEDEISNLQELEFSRRSTLFSAYISPEIALETKDSVVLTKMTLVQNADQSGFDISPKDSVELVKEAQEDDSSKKKPSKLVLARDSLEITRMSIPKLRSETTCAKKESYKSRSKVSVSNLRQQTPLKDVCCDKCYRLKSSTEVLDGLIPKQKDTIQPEERSFRISHIEVITVPKDENLEVAFESNPIVYKGDEEQLDLERLYQKKAPSAKPKKPKKQHPMPQVKILGDPDATEHLQNIGEFTAARVHSFIMMIKEHPNLIRTFTACRR